MVGVTPEIKYQSNKKGLDINCIQLLNGTLSSRLIS